MVWFCLFAFFFFKQKTAYEMRISDWSSDVCSSDLNQIASRTVGVGCEGRNNRLHFHADTAPAACERGDFSLFAFSCHLAQRLAFIALDRKSTRLTPVTNAHLVCRLLLETKNNIARLPHSPQHQDLSHLPYTPT